MRYVITLLCCAMFLHAQTGKWPTLATDQDLIVAKDRSVDPTLTAGINASTLSIPVTNGSVFVAYEIVRIDNEQIQICDIVTNTLTACSRGFASTSAAAHLTGAAVRNVISAYSHNALRVEMKATQARILPGRAATSGTMPGTCVASKEVLYQTDTSSLYGCNSGGNGWNPLSVAGSSEAPYSADTSGWAASGSVTVAESTHARGAYANGQCLMDNGTKDEIVNCKVERAEANGDLTFTYTTKPDFVLIFRGDKAQGPTGATGATGAAGALNLVGVDGSSQTARARINLKTGTNMTITAADNAGTNSVDVTLDAAGSGAGIINCNDATGSGTTYTCPSAGASSLTDLVVMFKPQTTSSGAATVNVSSLGAKSILRQSGNSVISGELRAGERYLLKYNGTAFVMDGEYLENTDGKLDIGRGTHPRTINVTAGVFAEITGANDLTGANSFSQRVRLIPMAYASLPTCVSGIRGAIAAITDSNTVTWGATAAGGGSDYAQVNCNGMNWTVTGK